MSAWFVPEPVIIVSGVVVVLACACGAVAAILGANATSPVLSVRLPAWVERERDLATGLGLPWSRWVAVRATGVACAVAIGVWSQILLLTALLIGISIFGVRFAVSGRAARRRLAMERAFLGQLRALRDRMVIGNHSLDTALQEIARNPGPELAHTLNPLADSASIVDGIVETARRSGSPIVEQACAVLLWARTRNLDALIATIDGILLPVGEAQLEVQEESLVALAQQRAVTFAMAALMLFMFITVLRVESFRLYYQSLAGAVTLTAAVLIFGALIASLGRIARAGEWTRWDLRKVAEQEAHPHG